MAAQENKYKNSQKIQNRKAQNIKTSGIHL